MTRTADLTGPHAATPGTARDAGPAPADTAATTVLSAEPTPAELLALARTLAAEPGLTDRLPDESAERSWIALPVGSGTQAWLIAWPPGTGTGWHDHGEAQGAMVVVAGTLTERSTERPEGYDLSLSQAQAQAQGQGQAQDRRQVQGLELPDEDDRLRRFGAAEGRSFTARHVHEVTNEGPVTAYSVHIYHPDLTLMRRYVPSGGLLLPIGTESAGDW